MSNCDVTNQGSAQTGTISYPDDTAVAAYPDDTAVATASAGLTGKVVLADNTGTAITTSDGQQILMLA